MSEEWVTMQEAANRLKVNRNKISRLASRGAIQTRDNPSLPPLLIKPVGMYPGGVSPCGAEEMVGNVSEVMMSMSNVDIRRDGSLIVNGTDSAIRRGGNCGNGPTEMRAAYRPPTLDSDSTYKFTGFRMVSTPVEPFDQCVMHPVR